MDCVARKCVKVITRRLPTLPINCFYIAAKLLLRIYWQLVEATGRKGKFSFEEKSGEEKSFRLSRLICCLFLAEQIKKSENSWTKINKIVYVMLIKVKLLNHIVVIEPSQEKSFNILLPFMFTFLNFFASWRVREKNNPIHKKKNFFSTFFSFSCDLLRTQRILFRGFPHRKITKGTNNLQLD